MILFYEDPYSSFLIFCHCCDCKNLILLFASLYFFISHFHQIIHYCIFNSPGYIKNQFNDQLPFGLLAQLVKVLHQCLRDQSSNSGKPEFFRLSFLNCISCIFNCKVLLQFQQCESYNILIIIISRILLMACRVLTLFYFNSGLLRRGSDAKLFMS